MKSFSRGAPSFGLLHPPAGTQGGRSADRRRCGSAAPVDPPCGRVDPWFARDHRPMTLAGAPLGAPPRLLLQSRAALFRRWLAAWSASSWQGDL